MGRTFARAGRGPVECGREPVDTARLPRCPPSSRSPATGSAPRCSPRRSTVLRAVADDLDVRGAPVRRRLDRRPRDGADRRHAGRLPRPPTPCCSAAVGGPKWDSTDPGAPRPEQGLLAPAQGPRPLRQPAARCGRSPRCYDASPLKRELIEGTDMLVVRELTGGIYFGEKTRTRERRVATSACTPWPRSSGSPAPRSRPPARGSPASTRPTCSRPAGCGARSSRACTPRSSRTSSSSTCSSTRARCSSIAAPRHFDVILTENMFGDILSDEAAMLTGSLGHAPERLAGRRRARPVRARARLGARHRRHRASPTRWR